MIYNSIKAGLVFLIVTMTVFCAASYALDACTIDVGKGTELAGSGFVILSPLIGLFLVLGVSAGLVASRVVYRISARSSAV